MAENTYNISLREVYPSGLDVSSLEVTVNNNVGGAHVGGLIKDNFKIFKNNSSTEYTDFTVTENTTFYTITITGTVALAETITVQVEDGTDKSDKLFVDFREEYPTSGIVQYDFKLPVATGEYKMKLDKVDGVDFSVASSDTFMLRGDDEVPVATASSISLLKPYLVHFAGEVLKVTVELKGTAGATVPTGNYEVSLFGDKE